MMTGGDGKVLTGNILTYCSNMSPCRGSVTCHGGDLDLVLGCGGGGGGGGGVIIYPQELHPGVSAGGECGRERE